MTVEKWYWEPVDRRVEMTGRPNRQVMETLTEVFGEPPWTFSGDDLERLRLLCLGARSVTGLTEAQLVYEFFLDVTHKFGGIRVGSASDFEPDSNYPEHD
jgi:hypothetical protein